jgi:hypothetical protein
MTTILDLSVNDETLNNIITGNPYYIDIKGSVNICTIRCGQKIDQCNEVVLSTMTNYGKILVLNPNKNSKSKAKCSIKLAFDTNNDNIGVNGEGNYLFEKAFITVPSLHKLNGQIYDMETFLLFSSTQKNGNILYVCVCTFSTGTSTVQAGDPKLLNYKLMNELFTKNVVPDMYGTNQIKGRPNPVDLSNFIPPNGLQNFYDYTHPANNKVNFRIHQEIMYVSNDVLNTLKGKLTPGNIYTDFKSAIGKTINPFEGLFFYFSEDLTNRYKSYQQNQINEENKESFNDEIEKNDNDESDEKEVKFKKLENENKDSKKIEDDDLDDSNKEKFTEQEEDINDNATSSINNNSIYLFFIIGFLFAANCFHTFFLTNIFTSSNGISESDLPNYLNQISDPSYSNLISTKFKLYFNIFLQGFFSLFLFILIPIFISTNIKYVYTLIIFFMVLLLLNLIRTLKLNIDFFVLTLKGIYDRDFIQKQNYFSEYINNKVYQGSFIKIISNFFKYSFSNNYDKLIDFSDNNNIMSGGGDGDGDSVSTSSTESKKEGYIAVPGSNGKEDQNIKNMMQKKEILGLQTSTLNPIGTITQLFSLDVIKERFSENPAWKRNLYFYFAMLLVFFVIGSLLDLRFISKTSENNIKFLVSSLIVIVSFFPFILGTGLVGSLLVDSNGFRITILIISIITLILSFFGMPFIKSLPQENLIYYIIIILIFINIFIVFLVKIISTVSGLTGFMSGLFGSKRAPSGSNDNSPSEQLEEGSAPSMEDFILLKKQLEQEKMKTALISEELFSNNKSVPSTSGSNRVKDLEELLKNKNKNINNLKNAIKSLIANLNKYKLNSVKNLLNTLISILENKTEIDSIKSEKSKKEQILSLLDNISKNQVSNAVLKSELEKLKVNNSDEYDKFTDFLKQVREKIEST